MIPSFRPLRIVSLSILCGLLLGACHHDAREDWPDYLGDKRVSHYSALHQIDTGNAARLVQAWVFHTGDVDSQGHSQIQCNPLVMDGVLYGVSPALKLFALDAATGRRRWIFDPFAGSGHPGGVNACRGMASWSGDGGRRLFYTAGSYLYAIDAASGKPVTSFGDSGRVDLHEGLDRDVAKRYVTATSPGIVYRDLLILGTRVAEDGDAAPGHIRAFDVRSGRRRWIFHTIPQPGEYGYGTWEDSAAWTFTGGGNNWAGMSLDEKRGVVYVPTGSAAFDFYGGLRRGQNLFTNSVLALDAATGRRRWHYQTLHHDLWDRDLPAPPNLVSVTHGGRRVEALAQITKTGYVFLLDRDSGKPLFPVDELPVTDSPALPGERPWPTQPRPRLPAPFARQHFGEVNPLLPDSSQEKIRRTLSQIDTGDMFMPPSERGTLIFPGFDGGGEWGGAAYDPATGWLYVNANQVPWILTMVPAGGKTMAGPGGHGRQVYLRHCMACHGPQRLGNGSYPSLLHLEARYSRGALSQLIDNGRRMMPGFRQLPAADKKALLAYLLEQPTGVSKEAADIPREPHPVPYSMTGYNKFRSPEGYPANAPPWGTLSAIDLNSGKTMWQVPLGNYAGLRAGAEPTGTENYGGPVVTAGGLVFIAATLDEKFRVFDKRSGRLLWETALPAAGYATPATYMVNGRQYVVIACGGGKLGTRSGDAYVAFALPEGP